MGLELLLRDFYICSIKRTLRFQRICQVWSQMKGLILLWCLEIPSCKEFRHVKARSHQKRYPDHPEGAIGMVHCNQWSVVPSIWFLEGTSQKVESWDPGERGIQGTVWDIWSKGSFWDYTVAGGRQAFMLALSKPQNRHLFCWLFQ